MTITSEDRNGDSYSGARTKDGLALLDLLEDRHWEAMEEDFNIPAGATLKGKVLRGHRTLSSGEQLSALTSRLYTSVSLTNTEGKEVAYWLFNNAELIWNGHRFTAPPELDDEA